MPVVLLSGAMASGKSAVALALAGITTARVLTVRAALESFLSLPGADRTTLQREGARLDLRTNGRWLVECLERENEVHDTIIVDSVRTLRQTEPVLNSFTDSSLVYLEASEDTRRRRFALGALSDPLKRSLNFDATMAHPTERDVTLLRPAAHLLVETDDLTPSEIASEVALGLRLAPG